MLQQKVGNFYICHPPPPPPMIEVYCSYCTYEVIDTLFRLQIYFHRLRATMCKANRPQFFFCKRGLPSRDISANHMARILSTSYINVCAMLMIDLRHLKIRAIWLAEISRDGNPRLQKKIIANRPRIFFPGGTFLFKKLFAKRQQV